MNKYEEPLNSTAASLWNCFRFIFVLFFLFLMGDAFYRWDGFKLYATFSDFFVSLAFVSLFWTAVAAVTAYLLWIPDRIISLSCLRAKWNMSERVMLFVHILLFLTIATLLVKRLMFPRYALPGGGIGLLAAFSLGAAVLTWAMEKYDFFGRWRSSQNVIRTVYLSLALGVIAWTGWKMFWPVSSLSLPLLLPCIALTIGAALCISWLMENRSHIIQERITPLVWLFGLFVFFSFLLIGYQMLSDHHGDSMTARPAASGSTEGERPNIIFLTFDALTTKDMSGYGYHRQTTPHIDEWAKEAFRFSRFKASGNWTSTTVASLMTGKRVWTHNVFQPHGFNIDKSNRENLPYLLKENGYFTMAYVANKFASLSRNGLARHYDINYPTIIFRKWLNNVGRLDLSLYEAFGDKILFYDWVLNKDFVFGKFLRFFYWYVLGDKNIQTVYVMDKVFNKFMHDIDKSPQQPFFAWIHIYQPHAPYMAPSPYLGMFGPYDPATETFYTSRDRYDELIRYCDKKFAGFMSALEKRDLLKNTVFILSSDHGEMFEDIKIGHGGRFLHEPITSIPLVIKQYDKEGGQVISDLAEQVDLTATILDFANIPIPDWVEGRSLVPLMEGEALSDRPVFSMNFEANKSGEKITKGVIAVWEGDYKLMYSLDDGKAELYNLKDDPDEGQELSAAEPERVGHLLDIINADLKAANERIERRPAR